MPYATRSRTGTKPAPVPLLDCCEDPKTLPKTTRKKPGAEGKSKDKKGKGRPKTAAESSESSSSNNGTLRRRPKEMPILSEDEEKVSSEPTAPKDPMENHRKNYGYFANLLEAYSDTTEEDKLAAMYDAMALRTRKAMKGMQRLNEKHKDDQQSILAKTPLGKKIGLKTLKEESDEEDLFEDSDTDATSVASSVASKSGAAQVLKTPIRKLRPRKRKSVLTAKSPWRQAKVVKAKKRKSVMKRKKVVSSQMDHDSSASTQASNHQDEAPPPAPAPVLLQVQPPNIKKAQKRPVETTPQKTIFSVPSEFDFGHKVPEPSSKKRILAHPGYKAPTVGHKTDKPIDAKEKKFPTQGSSSSNEEAPKQEKRAKGSKDAAKVANEKKKSTERKPESKDVRSKKTKKNSKTEKAGGDKSNDIQVSQPVVQQSAPQIAAGTEAGEEPLLFETPESLKPGGPSKASSQKTAQVYNATYVVSDDDEPMQIPNKVTPGSSSVKPGLCDGTFVVPKKKNTVERKPSTGSYPSKAGNSTPINIGDSTFTVQAAAVVPAPAVVQAPAVVPPPPVVPAPAVVPAPTVVPKEPLYRSSKDKVIPRGSGSERSAPATAIKKVPSTVFNVKPTQPAPVSSSAVVEKSLHPKLSGKEKLLLANSARKGSASSSTASSSGDSQASSAKTLSSVISGKSNNVNQAGKLMLPRQSPGMVKDYGHNKLHQADPVAELKRQEEKQKKAEEKKNQFIQQKREMQKKINEEWKAKLEKKKEEDARQADEKNKIIQSGKAEEAKGVGYVKNIINFFKTPGVVQVGVKVATLPLKNLMQAGAMTAASSCPDVSKKFGTVPGSSAMKQKDVYGSVGQLVGGSSKGGTGVKVPSKPSPKKPAPKPAVFISPPFSAPKAGPAAAAAVPAKARLHQDNGFFETSGDEDDCDESFATADTTMDERNENVNNYEITVYEDLDDNMKHRENKRIPAWAADEDRLNLALFLQQPDLMRLIRKPMFPQKNVGFKIFPDVPH